MIRGMLVAAMLTLAAVSAGRAAPAEDARVVGTWLDKVGKSWECTITIVEAGDLVTRTNVFHDGSVVTQELREIPALPGRARTFRAVNNAHGEYCAIDGQGNLELYDDEGFIREARPKPGGTTRSQS